MTAHRTVPAWNDGRGYVEEPAPRPPFLMASDPGHGEYFIDADGRAYNAVRERLPSLDAPPALPERDRAGDAEKLAALWREEQEHAQISRREHRENALTQACARMVAIECCAAALGLGDELRGLIDGGK